MTDGPLMDADCVHGVAWYECEQCEPPPVTFHIHIELDHYLTAREVWPDNDGPKDPTAEDVAEAMERTNDGLRNLTSPQKVLKDWNLLGWDDDFHVTVTGPGMDEDVTTVTVWRDA